MRYSLWANEAWITFIGDRFPSDEFLLRRMSHILLGEQAWFQRIFAKELDREIWRTMTIPQLTSTLKRHAEHYDRILGSDITRVLAYKRFTGEEYQSPVSDILLHLSLHGSHHRGQMATHVSAKGT